MAVQFRVQGELTLAGAGQFIGELKRVSSAAAELTQETGRSATATTRSAAATVDLAQKTRQLLTAQAEVRTTAAAGAKAQADAAARLAAEQARGEQQARASAAAASAEAQAVARQYQASLAAVQQLNQATRASTGDVAQNYRASLTAATRAGQSFQQVNQQVKASIDQVRAANDNAAHSVRAATDGLAAHQKLQLGYQLNDIFVGLTTGQRPLMVMLQQGPQITQIFGGISNTLRAIPWAAAGYTAAIGAVAAVTVDAALRVNSLALEHRRLEVSLQATGRTARLTATQLQEMIRAEAERPGAGREETRLAAQQLLANAAITGENVQATLSLARDLARVTGQELPAAAAALSEGLDGTAAGALKLDQAFHALTPSELEQVRRLGELGDKAGVVSIVLAALQRNLGNANDRALSPFEAGTAKLRASWNSLLDSLGRTGAIQGLAVLLNQVAAPLHLAAWAAERLRDAMPSNDNAPATAEVERARKRVADERLTLELLRQDRQKAHRDDQHAFELSIQASRRRLGDAQAELSRLEAKSGAVAAKAVQDQVDAAATALSTELKTVDEIVARAGTVAGKRRELEAERTRIGNAIAAGGGLLDPDQLARWQERLGQIDGALAGLRTPAQELQRTLDQETQLSRLPQHLRAAEQAFVETRRRALEAGQSEAEATRLADQARRNALQSHAAGTHQQIERLSAEAVAALRVADAYGVSRVEALRLQAESKAAIAAQQGQIAPGSAGAFARRSLEQEAATAIAASAEKAAVHAREIAALERLVEAEGRGSAAAREAERANKVAALAEDLRAQAAATNSATIVAAADRQIAVYDELSRKAQQVEIRREAQALNRQHDPAAAYDHEIARIRELEATGLLTARTVEEVVREAERRKLEASRDATDGMIAGLRRYAEEATNAGQAASQGVQQGLKTMEAALVQFTTTGQINFSNFANSIIADLARVAIRQHVTGPIARAIGGIDLGRIFSGGGGGGAVIGPGTGYTYHTGGMATAHGTSRSLPAWVWNAAPRFHSGRIPGLAANEVPAILTDDEEVLTSSHPRHRWNVNQAMNDNWRSAAPSVKVNVIFNGGERGSVSEGPLVPDGQGGWTQDIIVDRLEETMANRVLDGRGKMAGAMQTAYGLKRVGRR